MTYFIASIVLASFIRFHSINSLNCIGAYLAIFNSVTLWSERYCPNWEIVIKQISVFIWPSINLF